MSNMTPILQKVFDDFVAAEQERDALKLENAVLKARIAELEAIGRAYAWCNNLPHASQLFGLRVFDHDEDGDFIWSPLAHAFVALLNEERKI